MKKLLSFTAAVIINVFANAQASLSFDGSNDYVQIPNMLSSVSAFTIEYWIKTTQTGSSGAAWYNGAGLVDAEMPGAANDFGTSLNGSKVSFGIGNSDVTITSTSNVNTNNWTHIAVSWNSADGAMKLYINGTLEASGTGATALRNVSTTITFGAINTLGNYYKGIMDEVRIWNVARSQSDIQNNMCSSISAQANLVAYYTFSAGTPNSSNAGITTLADLSGNAYNGTLTNFALNGMASNFTSDVFFNSLITQTQTQCGGSYTWEGTTYSSSGTYTSNYSPCLAKADTLYLTINPIAHTSVYELQTQYGGSYTWAQTGHTYTQTGLYHDTLTSVGGCDSIVSLHLGIKQWYLDTVTATGCDSYTWTQTGQTYTATGYYTDTLSAILSDTFNYTGSDQTFTVPPDITALNIQLYGAGGAASYNQQRNGGSGAYVSGTLNVSPMQTLTIIAGGGGNTAGISGGIGTGGYGGGGKSFSHGSGGGRSAVTDGANDLVTGGGGGGGGGGAGGAGGSGNGAGGDSHSGFCNCAYMDEVGTLGGGGGGGYSGGGGGASFTTNLTGVVVSVNGGADNGGVAAYLAESYKLLGGNGRVIISYAGYTDTVRTLNLSAIRYTTHDTVTVAKCVSYTIGVHTYTASGTYTDTLTSVVTGCDSIITTNLTIKPDSYSTISVTECNRYTWNGNIYTASGTYVERLTGAAANGCDSIVTINLTINRSDTVAQTVTAYDSYTFFGTDITASGTYWRTLTGSSNAYGCDSVAKLNLTIKHLYYDTVAVTGCDSYTWAQSGQTYTASGMYNYTIIAAFTDTLRELLLTVNRSDTAMQAVSDCYSYAFYDSTFTTTGTHYYKRTGATAHGCDSVYILNVTINRNDTVSLTPPAVCGSYAFYDAVYTTSGRYYYTRSGVTATGCDSVYVLNLTVNPIKYASVTQVQCGGTYTWAHNAQTYTQSGVYSDTLAGAAANGCDSIVTLNLTIYNIPYDTLTATACNSYTHNYKTYTQSGTYNDTIPMTTVVTNTFAYIGANQTFVVPAGVTHLNVQLYGAGGGSSLSGLSGNPPYYIVSGGPGAYVSGVLSVTPGDEFTIIAGGGGEQGNSDIFGALPSGAFGGGGGGDWDDYYGNLGYLGGYGGGRSAIQSPVGTDIVTAGGGGGGGAGGRYSFSGGVGGAGGGTNGGNSGNNEGTGGQAGTATAGGAGGTPTGASLPDYSWMNGSQYQGGGGYTYHYNGGGGSGGGGYYGGGGGVNSPIASDYSGGGGGGGSSYTGYVGFSGTNVNGGAQNGGGGYYYDSSGNVAYSNASPNGGNGQVIISYNAPVSGGCDTIKTLNLTINHNDTAVQAVSGCYSYTFFDSIYTTAGTRYYTKTDATVHGCDSVYVLDVVINRNDTTVINATACHYAFYDSAFTTAGTHYYKRSEATNNGCDSVYKINLTVPAQPATSTITVTMCGIDTFANRTYTSTIVGGSSLGCDSVITMHLVVTPPTYSSNETQTVCDSVVWNGTAYKTSGHYTDGVACNFNTLHLTVKNGTHRTLVQTAHQNYVWHGTTYSASGTYTYNYINDIGCPSSDELHLTISGSPGAPPVDCEEE